MIEFVKGHVAFPGTESKYGTWTAEDDRLALLIDVFGPFPQSLLQRSARAAEFFDDQGMTVNLSSSALHVTVLSCFSSIETC